MKRCPVCGEQLNDDDIDSPWLPPNYEPPPEIDPWECSAPDCTAIARYVKNGRPTCADHKEDPS